MNTNTTTRRMGLLTIAGFVAALGLGACEVPSSPMESTSQYDTTTDTDGDGLADDFEVLLGYDPELVDTDGNGVWDGDEDYDGDGVSNLDELANNTDPTNPEDY